MVREYEEECGLIERALGATVDTFESVQSLWSGYGEILRARLMDAPRSSVIVKTVHPPKQAEHPRGWGGSASHSRKLRSYSVERNFYESFEPRCRSSSRTAVCYASHEADERWIFLLEDLDAAGFARRPGSPSEAEIVRCISWLASFHGTFLGASPTGLWPIGTYWHLATRAEEYAALDDRLLREAAPALDRALRACRYTTLVHGDAKIANFCFADSDVAAVDFQYVGGGCGMKDLAYLLSSCLSEQQCERLAAKYLDIYFAELRRHLPAETNSDELEAEWRRLYPAAWADFHRFLAGWAPHHWKIHAYTRTMTEQALQEL